MVHGTPNVYSEVLGSVMKRAHCGRVFMLTSPPLPGVAGVIPQTVCSRMLRLFACSYSGGEGRKAARGERGGSDGSVE